MNEMLAPGIVEHLSPLGFDKTVKALVDAVTSHGMTVFARIDHAANAQAVGMAMPPSTVLIYGSPKGGTPVMLGTPLAALDLPLRVLVRGREDGSTTIAFHPVVDLLQLAGVTPEVAGRLEPAQQMLVAAVTR